MDLEREFKLRLSENETSGEFVELNANALPIETSNNSLIEQPMLDVGNFSSVVGEVEQRILSKAQEKIGDERIIDKHAENLKQLADKKLEVQAEHASLTVKEQEANNKVLKQEIRNRLIVLKSEARRLKKEQRQLNKEQKADHRARNKQAKWELYKDKLEKMRYTYVPCTLILAMLLFFDGVRSFFEGLGTVSTAIVKALKWVLLFGAIVAILFAIPVTREWLINLLSGK